MKHTKEEILNALHVIKDECGEYERCDERCPFNANDECLVNINAPNYWKINDDGVEVWKGLL